MLEKPIVSFEPGHGFSLVGADIFVDKDEFEGVQIAARNLAKDFSKVTGTGGNSVVTAPSAARSKSCIIIGTESRSPTIKGLRDREKVDISDIGGKWETWKTTCVADPMEGYDHGLLIVGSDKRGAIFGAYSLSEQIGVSP